MVHSDLQVIRACLLRGRQPDVPACPPDQLISVSNERAGRLEAMRVVPYPEPGKWYLGFQGRHSIENNNWPKVGPKTGPRCNIEKDICMNYLKAYTSLPEFWPENWPQNWTQN